MRKKKQKLFIPLFARNILCTEQKADLNHHYHGFLHLQQHFYLGYLCNLEYKNLVITEGEGKRYLRLEFLRRTWTRIMVGLLIKLKR